MQAAAEEFSRHDAVPFAGYVSDPCDGRTQGTPGMMDSLAYRNDAAIVLRRLIRSLPTRRGVMGVATCDKGLPAMMMALAGQKSLPGVIVPGGVTLLPAEGEDAGKVQSLGARFAHGLVTHGRSRRAGLPRLRIAGRRLPVPRHCGHQPGRRGGAGAAPCRTRRCRRPGSRSGWTWRAAPPCALMASATRRHTVAAHPDRRLAAQRDGDARGVRRQHQPDHAHPRHRPRRQAAAPDRRRLGTDQSPGAAPGRRAAERPDRLRHGAGLPGRRRPRSDAAPPRDSACCG